ncbi:hypothetical protein ACFL0Q_07835 [Thermodesulfobacteriota bacterium]
MTSVADGKSKRTRFHNLPAIIATGYRVRSHRDTTCVGHGALEGISGHEQGRLVSAKGRFCSSEGRGCNESRSHRVTPHKPTISHELFAGDGRAHLEPASLLAYF